MAFGGVGGVDSSGFLGASEFYPQFGMAVIIFVVDGVYGINLFNIGGCILVSYFYNKHLLKCMG